MKTALKVLTLAFVVLPITAWAQKTELQFLNQTVKGIIIDKDSRLPMIGASVTIISTDPIMGSSTDVDGYFKIEHVPIGRHQIEISFIGYETVYISEVLVTSGKELDLNIEMTESVNKMEDIIISATENSSEAINEMAAVSARQFSVEESSRYAAAAFDPARMALNYAGVSTGNTDDLTNQNCRQR